MGRRTSWWPRRSRTPQLLVGHDTVCIESTGTSAHVPWALAELGQLARMLPVRVLVTRDQALTRIRSRDPSEHIPVSDDQIEQINAIAERVELEWAAEIDNRGAFDRVAIVTTIRWLLAPASPQRG